MCIAGLFGSSSPPPPPPPPSPPPPQREAPASAGKFEFCECDFSLGTWTLPQATLRGAPPQPLEDGVELCELKPNPDCVFAVGGFPVSTRTEAYGAIYGPQAQPRKPGGVLAECWLVSGRGLAMQRSMAVSGATVSRDCCRDPNGRPLLRTGAGRAQALQPAGGRRRAPGPGYALRQNLRGVLSG